MYAIATIQIVCSDCHCTVDPAFHVCSKNQRPIKKASER